MEAAKYSETIVSYHITTWCHNPEDHNMNLQCHENLKSCLRSAIILHLWRYEPPWSGQHWRFTTTSLHFEDRARQYVQNFANPLITTWYHHSKIHTQIITYGSKSKLVTFQNQRHYFLYHLHYLKFKFFLKVSLKSGFRNTENTLFGFNMKCS